MSGTRLYALCLGVAYITSWTVLGFASVGEMSGPPEPHPWWIPFAFFSLTAIPFWLGWTAGRED